MDFLHTKRNIQTPHFLLVWYQNDLWSHSVAQESHQFWTGIYSLKKLKWKKKRFRKIISACWYSQTFLWHDFYYFLWFSELTSRFLPWTLLLSTLIGDSLDPSTILVIATSENLTAPLSVCWCSLSSNLSVTWFPVKITTSIRKIKRQNRIWYCINQNFERVYKSCLSLYIRRSLPVTVTVALCHSPSCTLPSLSTAEVDPNVYTSFPDPTYRTRTHRNKYGYWLEQEHTFINKMYYIV